MPNRDTDAYADEADGHKRCRDCGEVKPFSEFWRRKQSADGWALYCKECFGLRNSASYRGRRAMEGKKTRPYRRHSAVPEGMKYCPVCGETKPVTEFGRNRANKSGLADYCRPCHNRTMAENKKKIHGSTRSYHLKRRYGLTDEQVAELRERQVRRCLICLKEATLYVDHDHASGEFRGLLCFNCNNGLGQFRDDQLVLRRAANYLDGAALIARSIAVQSIGDAAEDGPARRSWSMGQELRRHYRVTQRYGIGLDEVNRMIEQQGGLCPICGSSAPRDVDHDHKTGAVRGILCSGCNSGMGQFKDDPRVLRKAAGYLDGTLVRLDRSAWAALWVVAGSEPPEPQFSPLEALVAATISEFSAN